MPDANGWPSYAVKIMQKQEQQAGDVAVIRDKVERIESGLGDLDCGKHKDRLTAIEIATARQAVKTGFVGSITGVIGGVLTMIAAWLVRRG